MKTIRILLIAASIIGTTSLLLADGGSVGVYAVVRKIVFEPNEETPTAIQIWGLFAWVDGGLDKPGEIKSPLTGYMYFKLPGNGRQATATKKQWTEIKAIAGTDQIIAFGDWDYEGAFEDFHIPVAGGQESVRVRRQSESPEQAITYSIKPGLLKVANDARHAKITELMKGFLQR